MQTLLVTYDLSAPGRDYEALFEVLKRGSSWWHHLESVWIITGARTPDQLFDEIRPHLRAMDRVLIVQLHDRDPRQGWLPKQAWDWLNENMAR